MKFLSLMKNHFQPLLFVISVLLMLPACTGKRNVNPPNILLILTDQQSANDMSCAGNEYLQTPAMDELAA